MLVCIMFPLFLGGLRGGFMASELSAGACWVAGTINLSLDPTFSYHIRPVWQFIYVLWMTQEKTHVIKKNETNK